MRDRRNGTLSAGAGVGRGRLQRAGAESRRWACRDDPIVDVPLTDADIGTLFEGMRRKGVVVRELQVKKDGLSPESIQRVSLMSPPVVTPPLEDNGAIRFGR